MVPFPDSATAPVVREMRQLPAEMLPPAGITYTTLEGYIAARVAVEGLRRAGPNPSREKFVSALESLKDYDVGGFPRTMRGSRLDRVSPRSPSSARAAS